MDRGLQEFIDLARAANSEDELNLATLHITDRHGKDVTPTLARRVLRNLKNRIWRNSFMLRIFRKFDQGERRAA